MSSNELTADVSMFFKLDMPLVGFRNTFRGIQGFSDLLGQKIPEIAPGVTVGPPSMPISQYKTTRIEYVGDRFILKQHGPLQELVELNEILPSMFEKQNYTLKEVVRFCEVDTGFQPLLGNGVADWIRSNVKVDLEGLSKVCGEELKPYTFWASNSNTPLTDTWLNVMLQPEANSPHKRLLWRIIKRTRTQSELSEFLMKMKAIIDEVGRMFGVP